MTGFPGSDYVAGLANPSLLPCGRDQKALVLLWRSFEEGLSGNDARVGAGCEEEEEEHGDH